MTIPLADQIKEVERELALRRGVYPYQVAKGKMEKHDAERQTARMEGVLATLRYVEKNAAAIRRIAARAEQAAPAGQGEAG